MRLNTLIIGLVLSGAGLTFILLAIVNGVFTGSGLFTISAGVFTIVLALATPKPSGVVTREGASSEPSLVVDKGVVRTTIYQLMFFNQKLVMKKLASVNVTVFLALVLAVVGFAFEGLVGALAGGLTGYSFQEYLTQKAREGIGRHSTVTGRRRGDLEFDIDDIDRVRLLGSSILLFTHNKVVRVSLPRGYVDRMRSSVESLFGDKYEEGPS